MSLNSVLILWYSRCAAPSRSSLFKLSPVFLWSELSCPLRVRERAEREQLFVLVCTQYFKGTSAFVNPPLPNRQREYISWARQHLWGSCALGPENAGEKQQVHKSLLSHSREAAVVTLPLVFFCTVGFSSKAKSPLVAQAST